MSCQIQSDLSNQVALLLLVKLLLEKDLFGGELLLTEKEFGLALDGVFVGNDSLLESGYLRFGAVDVEDAIELGIGITVH